MEPVGLMTEPGHADEIVTSGDTDLVFIGSRGSMNSVIHGNGEDVSVLDEVVAEDYIQLNPSAGEGREGLRTYFKRLIPLPDSQSTSGIVQVNYIVEGRSSSARRSALMVC